MKEGFNMNEILNENYDKNYVVAQLIDVLNKVIEKKENSETDETEEAA